MQQPNIYELFSQQERLAQKFTLFLSMSLIYQPMLMTGGRRKNVTGDTMRARKLREHS